MLSIHLATLLGATAPAAAGHLTSTAPDDASFFKASRRSLAARGGKKLVPGARSEKPQNILYVNILYVIMLCNIKYNYIYKYIYIYIIIYLIYDGCSKFFICKRPCFANKKQRTFANLSRTQNVYLSRAQAAWRSGRQPRCKAMWVCLKIG